MFQKFHKNNSDDSINSTSSQFKEKRRGRFRILVCIDGSAESLEGVRFASQIKPSQDCDIILLYVRTIDQGLRSGGLQIRLARENMLDWGLELPGIRYLKEGLGLLVDENELENSWESSASHTDSWRDPLGDNKVEYRHPDGRTIVLKLKTAPDPASGILDQYELGPYNLIIMGAPQRWRNELRAFFGAPVAQKVATLSPCSVLLSRKGNNANLQDGKGHLICVNGSNHSSDAMRRDAIFAHNSGHPITLFTVIGAKEKLSDAEKMLEEFEENLQEMGIKVRDKDVAIGDPVEEIVKKGGEYSVIAVAASSKQWYQRFFVTGVAFNVMASCETTVLNIR
jgi:nucleotide-binding universal stress UspA family protein